MTTANKITILRILLVPFFIAQMIYYTSSGEELHRLIAILIFGLAAVSDGLDGYIARKYNQRSELGALLDPIADKLLLVSAVILLSRDTRPWFERIPLWFTTTILSRDVILIVGVLVIHYTFGKVHVRPRIVGKVAAVLQMATVSWVMLRWDKDFIVWLAASAAILTGIAGLLYLFDGVSQLSKSPASQANGDGKKS